MFLQNAHGHFYLTRPSLFAAITDYENIPEASLVCQSSSGWSCLCLLSFIFVFQGLFTSLLALINSIVTVLIGPQLLHCSGACSILIYLDPCLSLLAGITLIVTSLPQVTLRIFIFSLSKGPMKVKSICISPLYISVSSLINSKAFYLYSIIFLPNINVFSISNCLVPLVILRNADY